MGFGGSAEFGLFGKLDAAMMLKEASISILANQAVSSHSNWCELLRLAGRDEFLSDSTMQHICNCWQRLSDATHQSIPWV
ncbi:hypothetical protein Cde04nite_35750 [Cellulomonas denverensis]|nr:hypothetical protein Cde04nite_35750 [Cellulomonas denverensis]